MPSLPIFRPSDTLHDQTTAAWVLCRRIACGLILALLLTACASTPPQSFNDNAIVLALNSQLNEWRGSPYLLGGNSKRGVDCSAFVQITFAEKFTKSIPRTTKQQVKVGKKIRRSHLRAGDLVFFKLIWNRRHVGIYTGNGEFIHASTSAGVKRSNLTNRYWAKHFWQARRISP